MKKRQTTSRELNRVVTSFTIYKFVKDMITPFEKMKLFKEGKIDKNGKYLIDPKKIPAYDRLIINLKKLLSKIPQPTTKAQLKHLTTALVLFTEETEKHGADPDAVFNEISDFLCENGLNIDESLSSLLNEEMIANSVSAGGVYGARGNPDETIVNQIAHLKRMKLMKRSKKPVYFEVGTKPSSE
jgi:hypothetical protein